jgi:hypothetical protein
MKWSELPQEYRDLEKGFNKAKCEIYKAANDIEDRFWWEPTPQGYMFWKQCCIAKEITELPEIPKNDK